MQRERRPAGAAKHARGRADPRLARQEGLAPPSDARCVTATHPQTPSTRCTRHANPPPRTKDTSARGRPGTLPGLRSSQRDVDSAAAVVCLGARVGRSPAAMPPVSLWLRMHAMPQHASCGTTMRHTLSVRRTPRCETPLGKESGNSGPRWDSVGLDMSSQPAKRPYSLTHSLTPALRRTRRASHATPRRTERQHGHRRGGTATEH